MTRRVGRTGNGRGMPLPFAICLLLGVILTACGCNDVASIGASPVNSSAISDSEPIVPSANPDILYSPTVPTPPTASTSVQYPSSESIAPTATPGILYSPTVSTPPAATTSVQYPSSESIAPTATPGILYSPTVSIPPTATMSIQYPSSESIAPTATPQILSYSINPASTVPSSLEEQIFKSGQVVRASLISATAGVETIPSGQGVASTYRAVQELRFTAHEYLKGTGPAEAFIVVRGKRTYLTEAEARRAADEAVSQRNTTWDVRQGVLFLDTLDPAYRPPAGSGDAQRSTTPALGFTVYHYDATNEWDYSIDTLSRAWLPASGPGSTQGTTARSSDAAAQTFITDVSTSPPSAISLADLRTEITEFESMMAAGAGIAGFEECVAGRIGHERHRRAVPWTPSRKEATLASDTAAGTVFDRYSHNYQFPAYDRFWLTGPGASLFQSQLDDDDTESANGYDQIISTVRPLPEGVYTFHRHWQLYSDIPCNFVPTDSYRDWTVTVTAPAGTVHEAFFDPVTIGSAVGADGSNGVLEPAGFSVGGTSTSVSGLKWENGVVTMTLSPAVSLAGRRIDFIGLDGYPSLTLYFDDAARGSGGALTWTVRNQPWLAGDLLMLRIENATPRIVFRDRPASVKQGETVWVPVKAEALDSRRNYSFRLTTDNTGIVFHYDNCGYTPQEVTIPLGNTSWSRMVPLRGCATPGATVTAELFQGSTSIFTTTHAMKVVSTDAALSGLALSGVTLSFNSSTTTYTATVANGVTETTVTPTLNFSGATHVIKLGGVVDEDGVVPLSVGANVITVEVTAEDGTTTRTYTVTVTRS